jgi:hypothetical protein
VNFARQLEDTFRRRGLASVDVRENADIPVNAKVFHFSNSALLVVSCHPSHSLQYLKRFSTSC